MNFKYIIKGMVGFLIIITNQNCFKEDLDVLNGESNIQNNGYLPLSPDNSWVYENRLGTLQPDSTFIYSGKSFDTENTISKVRQVITNNQGDSRFDYGFTPISLGKTIGGFFGGLDQIIKIGDDYIKKSIIRVEYEDNGEIKTRFEYKLDDQVFLTDKPLVENQLISSKSGTIGVENEDGSYIEYTVNSYFKGIFTEMPERLIGSNEERKLFSKFNSFMHTTDSIKIIKIVSTSAGGLKVTGKLDAGIPNDGTSLFIDNKDLVGVKLEGEVELTALGFIELGAKISPSAAGLRQIDNVGKLRVCESKISIDLNEVSERTTTQLVSNQVLYHRDNYWVKGVGNVKNITSPSIVDAQLDLVETQTVPSETFLKPVDENCIDESNTIKFSLVLTSKPNHVKVKYPITLDTRSYIQTLKRYTIRKTLN